MSIDPREAAALLLALDDAATSFLGFVRLMKPEWKVIPDFHLDLIDRLDRLEKGTLTHPDGTPCYSLLINMPPRHSKSSLATELFPAYYVLRDARRAVMSCAYNAELASDFGEKVRNYVTDPRAAQAFPSFALSSLSKAKDFWRTQDGGQYAGVGIGGTTTGRPANLLITDDPIKARDEAESATIRNKVWNYYVSALTTRKQPDVLDRPPIEIMILTRWHPDDPAGRIMETDEWKEGRWMHVCYPARVELDDPTAPQVPRNELPKTDSRFHPTDTSLVPQTRRYQALWPQRFDLDFLARRERLNPREFASLYQQQPYVEGGNIIKGYWWRYYATHQDSYPHVIIACDTAYKKTTTSDYSVIAVMAMDATGDILILDILRGRWDFPELKRLLNHQNSKWRGRGLRAIYVEDRASGQSLIQELRSQSGMSVIPFKTISDKVSRLHSVTPLIEGGRVYLPQSAAWLDDFVQECTGFPSSPNDDQVDALSLGLDVLSKIPLNAMDSFSHIPLHTSLNSQLSSKNSLASQFKNKPLRFLGS
jgi:predicted phage terminase large subunit-like protein